ncbi:MAG: hypothetical protein WC792_03235 [Candidatus Micrarchaeia archaeon]
MPVSFLDEGLPYLLLFAGISLFIAASYHNKWINPRKSLFKYQLGIDKVAEIIILGFALSVFFPALANSALMAFLAFVIGGGLLFAVLFRRAALEGIAAMMVLVVAFNFG